MKVSGSDVVALLSVGSTNLADGILVAAFPLAIARAGEAPSEVGLGVALLWVPTIVALLVGGRLLDSRGPAAIAVPTQAVRVALLVALVAAAAVDADVLLVVAVAGGLVNAGEFLFDSCLEVVVASATEESRLTQVFGWVRSAELVGNRLAGPAAGGLLVLASPALAFAVAAGLFSVSAVAARVAAPRAPARDPGTAPPTSRRVLRSVVDGPLCGLAVLGFVAGITVGLSGAMMVLFVTEVLELPESAYGLLLTSSAIGGVAGGLLAGRVGGPERPRPLAAVFGLAGVAYLGIVATSSPVVIYAAGLAFGAGMTVFGALSAAMRQRIAAPAERGSVATTFRALTTIGIPVGALASGPLAALTSVRLVFVAGCVLHLLAAAWYLAGDRTGEGVVTAAGTAVEPSP